MAQAPKSRATSAEATGPARVQAALAQLAQGKALTAAPYNLTAAQAQTIGVACLTAVMATDKTLRNAVLHALLGK